MSTDPDARDEGTPSSSPPSAAPSSESSSDERPSLEARRSTRPSRGSMRPSVGPHVEPPTPWSQLKHDVPSAVVVFLVALPLCLGIALASGAPLFAGLITGIVGGLVVSWASGSQLAVSGPAAGLAVIVLNGIESLGYEAFLLAVVLAGGMQIVLGFAKAGIIGWYFPGNVIRGLLAAIGALLILKQLPHAIGLDTDFMGDESFRGAGWHNTFTDLAYAFTHLRWGALIIASLGLVILFGWDKIPQKVKPKWLPAPLLVVTLGVLANLAFAALAPGLRIGQEHLVQLPSGGPSELLSALRFPDFSRITDFGGVWVTAGTLAIVASIETLLSIEAIDKLDPYKRTTPTNRELIAQGVGNITAGMIGGIPLTAVIVRGSANVHSGARTKMSAFLHGVLLLLAVVALPAVLNLIPLAALAAVLLHVGYKLSPVSLFRDMYARGWSELLPFLATFLAILLTNLLVGVGIGMAVAIFFILKRNFESPYFLSHQEKHADFGVPYIRMELSENVSFLNKASVIRALQELPKGCFVEIDGSRSRFIHPDVLDVIYDFRTEARLRSIEVVLIEVPHPPTAGGGH